MVKWVKHRDLDDFESVQDDISEALDYVNKLFVDEHKLKPFELNLSGRDVVSGRDLLYPKYYIDEGVEYYNTNDYRTHDAQATQETFRSDKNFRYGNKIPRWQTSVHARHYDRSEHERNLPDIRELDSFMLGYDMSKIYEENPYVSSHNYED
jgi:hypothetical protein